MAALTFTLRAEVPERLDLSALVPSALDGKSASEIEKIVVGTTRKAPAVGDLFKVSGDDVTDIRFAGGSERFDHVGKALAGGSIHVEGDVGGWLAAGMKSGSVTVTGSAMGPYAAAEISGGSVTIEGNAGDCLGAALPGYMNGMAGGFVLVGGICGEAAGDRMRRGTIAVLGGTGDATGVRMIGGSILSPSMGARTGLMMKRGTLISSTPVELSSTFVDSGLYRLPFLALLRKHLGEVMPRAAHLVPSVAHRFRGDMSMLGKGEVLVAQ
ncbi:Formyltransferase/hydrolase complex Fhc subunit C [Hartmannibacter diazotrophicus]|uniref:Formyltransferase/hydrolase complex Fhc subunit C n=1 Tax=Hartmannibacter diazotrophicus TaxID=1482074 RepID=A0A2C9D698_9HYPH|nr:formylmethanofuran dehydrogenase subunit C [Hartmannibacter diazotrophicus]SON55844.1 Formyltransferase/hydrolase complex Fhc subunit C [Hartmannibacter diazotrophicus]